MMKSSSVSKSGNGNKKPVALLWNMHAAAAALYLPQATVWNYYLNLFLLCEKKVYCSQQSFLENDSEGVTKLDRYHNDHC